MITLIADICGVIGTLLFLEAELRQLRKVYSTKRTSGLSLTHYKEKVVACVFTIACFGLTNLHFSLTIVSIQFCVVVTNIILIKKYRMKKDKIGMSCEDYTGG